MLATMVPELQKDMEHMEAYDMATTLKEMFQQQARQERFEIVKNLHSCKMVEGASVSPHVLKMKGYIDHLDRLGFPISQELATDLILNSLPDSYSQFMMSYNMNYMEKSISELHLMHKTAEQNVKKPIASVLMVQKGKALKKKGKGNAKVTKAVVTVTKPMEQVKPHVVSTSQSQKEKEKEGNYHFCHARGHWFRNCKLYLEDLNKKKSIATTTSGSHQK
ncbi:hypothetical protein Scep_014580 [Stephania cephalantha]|uniref:Zinc finger, CCHC-type n=1 Tax=Stephania cephalantha TaxID=152367 RepID=A0AAP0J1I2_9MAGN